MRRHSSLPTWLLTTAEPQNPLIVISEHHKIRRSSDFEVLRFGNGRSGDPPPSLPLMYSEFYGLEKKTSGDRLPSFY